MEQPLTTGHSQRAVVDERGVKVDRVTQSARTQVGGYRARATGTDGNCGAEPLERDGTKERRNAERIESVRDDANERERTNWTTEKSKQTTRRRRKRGVEGEDFIRERSRDGLGDICFTQYTPQTIISISIQLLDIRLNGASHI